MNRLMFISSDGHATAVMRDYRPFLDSRFHEEYDEFLVEYEQHGSKNFDPPAIRARMDPADADEWVATMIDSGRAAGNSDPHARLVELDREGIAAEVLFPDFGLPFELYSPALAAIKGYPPLTEEKIQAGNRAFNRWMSDFVSVDALRLKAVAAVSWTDVDAACAEITWIKDAGFCGIVLPKFDPAIPLYSDVYEPIWALLEDLELVVHSHVASSSTTNLPESPPDTPHVGSFLGLRGHSGRFHCHAILPHLIWGGVLERHPRVTIVFTEQGSGWVRPMLADMDYTYEGSYLRSDTRDVIRSKPSEYFERQCYLGSSLFSKAEADARHDIGIDKMMLGADYPHHEGMLVHGVANYLQATLGAARVPLDDARMMLSVNAAKVYGFDLPALQPVADRIGLDPDVVLEPPLEELYPRGDVHKPLVA